MSQTGWGYVLIAAIVVFAAGVVLTALRSRSRRERLRARRDKVAHFAAVRARKAADD